MRLNQKTRGRRFNRAKALHRKLGGIYSGNKNLQAKQVGDELSVVQGLIDRMITYREELLVLHNELLGNEQPPMKPEIRNFFDETE